MFRRFLVDCQGLVLPSREVDRVEVRGRRKSCAVRVREEGRHTVSKLTRTVAMKIAVQITRDAAL
ncbi:hypothetical protein E2C01_032895 [Portunus trituberculatus]|uniref:Uncharacterized protein n=1 Tax=Portunus trituberculatus TaxID=210409 RepID=A0A5B7EWF1_PORTR|nr:hypothetical protein [Portunus trituberculatus]